MRASPRAVKPGATDAVVVSEFVVTIVLVDGTVAVVMLVVVLVSVLLTITRYQDLISSDRPLLKSRYTYRCTYLQSEEG